MLKHQKGSALLVSAVITVSLFASCTSDITDAELSDTITSISMEESVDLSDTRQTEIITEESETSYTEKTEGSDISEISENFFTDSFDYDINEVYTTQPIPETEITTVNAETNYSEENDTSVSSQNIVTEVAVTEISNLSSITETVTENGTKTNVSNIKNETIIYSEFDYCKAILVTDEIYYLAYNYGSIAPKIVTLDENGYAVRSGALDATTVNYSVSQFDDRIYVMYNTYLSEFQKSGTACKIFDMELNEIAGYDISSFTKDPQYAAINENSIFYSKSGKIYSVGYDGKNKKVILDMKAEGSGMTSISSIAANNDYVAFTAQGAGQCYGVIDLKTNEVQIIDDDTIFYPEVFGDHIMFPSQQSTSGSATTASGKVVVFDGGEFKTIYPKSKLESGQSFCAMSNGGKLITQDFSEAKYGEGNMCLRLYDENGNCIKECITEYGYDPVAGDNGIMAYSFLEKNRKKAKNGETLYVSKIIPY